jgi:hypothetical protein
VDTWRRLAAEKEDSMTMSARISGLVLAAALVGACSEDEQDEQTTSDESAAVSDLANDLDMAGPGMMGPEGGPGMGPGAFFQCDPDPEVELGTICGRTVPIAAHFEWTDCETEMGTSSGTADIATASDDCAAGIEHQISFAVSHALPLGDGGTATATGDLSVALSRADHRATIDGVVSIALPFGEAGAAITGVVRVPPTECRYPIAGSVEHTLPDGTSHILAFGPACGQATADGEPVDLATWRPPGPGPGF